MRTKFNLYIGTAAAALTLAVLVIAAELLPVLKNVLKAAFIHHWTGKAVIMTVAFIVAGLICRKTTAIVEIPAERIAWWVVLGSLTAIALFYLAEFFI